MVVFPDVLELRWIEHDAAYEEHPQHEEDFEFGLIEILDSAYVEVMAGHSPTAGCRAARWFVSVMERDRVSKGSSSSDISALRSGVGRPVPSQITASRVLAPRPPP